MAVRAAVHDATSGDLGNERPAAPAAIHPALALQRRAGNRATADLLAAGQAKLDVGAADDPYEREADAVARQVVDALQQTAPATGERPGALPVHRAIWRVQRRATPEVGAEGGPVGAQTERSINVARSGGGRPLDPDVRRDFEGAMGADLSGVRLHSGPAAADLNDQVQARAFTVGNDIFFGRATPDLTSRPGQELLAHELTHTIQQGGGAASAARSIQRWWPWSTTQPQPGTGSSSPPPDPKVLLQEAETGLLKARQRLADKKKYYSTAKGRRVQKSSRESSLQQLEQNVKDAEERRDQILNAPQAKSWGDLSSWSMFGGSQRTGGGTKDDWTTQDSISETTGKNTSWWGTNARETDSTPPQEQGPKTESETIKQAQEDEKKASEFVKTVLDIPLIEINVSPDEIDEKVLDDWVEHKGGSQQKVSLSASNLKGAGKVEISYGRSGKYAGDMGPAYVAGGYFNSATGIEGFVGAKGGYEYDLAMGWERLAMGGKASAFAGVETNLKTEVVMKIGGKEAGRFKGSLGVTYGVGGEIGGTIAWPWGGDLEIKSNVKLAVGLGLAYEIDFKLPTATWARWGYDWLASWWK